MSDALLDRVSAYAFDRLERAGGNVQQLPEPVQTVVVVYTAQGIIDNGGLEYFFEADFPGNPPYAFFVEAFRRIGAESVASCIEDAAGMFPFADPHVHELKRQHWLNTVREDESHPFVRLSHRACGDESVYRKLADYVQANRNAYDAV